MKVGKKMTSISMQDFNSLRAEKDLAILDIRDTQDFNLRHLATAQSIPATSIPGSLNTLDMTKTYYIISYSGRRSEIIANYLTSKGFTAVHVIGGMRALGQLAA